MRKLLIAALISAPLSIVAQVNYALDSEWSASTQWRVNPANFSEEKVFLYLPVLGGYNLGLGHTGFSANDAVDGNQVNIGATISGLDRENHFLLDFSTELLALGYRTEKVQFRAGALQQFEYRTTYTKDFLEMIWLGNGHPDLIGNRISLDNTGVNALGYLKAYAGASVSIIPNKLSLGLNANIYRGAATVQTLESNFGLTTSASDYTITADGSLNISTSGINDLDSLNAESFLNDLAFSNKGIGADFGLIFNPSPKHEVKLSVLNAGNINWESNLRNYRIQNSEISFSGFDIQNIIGVNDTTDVIQNFIDSIAESFTPEEYEESFRTHLNPEFVASLGFMPSEKTRISAMFRSKNSFGTRINQTGLIYSRRFGRTLELSAGGVFFNLDDLIIPAGLLCNFGPFQLGVQTTNLLAAIVPNKSKYASVSFSLGLRFAKFNE